MPTVNLYEILQRPLTIPEVDANMQIVQLAVDNQDAAIAAAVATAADRIQTGIDRSAATVSATEAALSAAAAAASAAYINGVAGGGTAMPLAGTSGAVSFGAVTVAGGVTATNFFSSGHGFNIAAANGAANGGAIQIFDSSSSNMVAILNGGATIATISSTGLAVTGGISASGAVSSALSLTAGAGTSAVQLGMDRNLLFYNTTIADGLIQSADDASTFTSASINKTNFKLYASNALVANFSSTGLSVTGKITSTGDNPALILANDNYGFKLVNATGLMTYYSNGITALEVDVTGKIFAQQGLAVTGGISATGQLKFNPTTSVTTSNGEMYFQRSSNTSLWVILKGDDGIERHAVLTLVP